MGFNVCRGARASLPSLAREGVTRSVTKGADFTSDLFYRQRLLDKSLVMC